jgi:hypothetical protein
MWLGVIFKHEAVNLLSLWLAENTIPLPGVGVE